MDDPGARFSELIQRQGELERLLDAELAEGERLRKELRDARSKHADFLEAAIRKLRDLIDRQEVQKRQAETFLSGEGPGGPPPFGGGGRELRAYLAKRQRDFEQAFKELLDLKRKRAEAEQALQAERVELERERAIRGSAEKLTRKATQELGQVYRAVTSLEGGFSEIAREIESIYRSKQGLYAQFGKGLGSPDAFRLVRVQVEHELERLSFILTKLACRAQEIQGEIGALKNGIESATAERVSNLGSEPAPRAPVVVPARQTPVAAEPFVPIMNPEIRTRNSLEAVASEVTRLQSKLETQERAANLREIHLRRLLQEPG